MSEARPPQSGSLARQAQPPQSGRRRCTIEERRAARAAKKEALAAQAMAEALRFKGQCAEVAHLAATAFTPQRMRRRLTRSWEEEEAQPPAKALLMPGDIGGHSQTLPWNIFEDLKYHAEALPGIDLGASGSFLLDEAEEESEEESEEEDDPKAADPEVTPSPHKRFNEALEWCRGEATKAKLFSCVIFLL